MKKEKQGIEEIKEFIDFTYLIKKVLSGKLKWWEKLLGRYKDLIKAVKDGIELYKDRNELLNEFKDLDESETLELNKYVKKKYNVTGNTTEAIEHLIKGTFHFIEAYKILK